MSDDVFTNEIPRDRFGRPMILQPNGKRRGYRRATKFIKVLEDTKALDDWRVRMVALGLGKRQDLHLAASSLTEAKEDRTALQNVADKAIDAAKQDKALMGTALHKLVERLDRGQKIGDVPAAYVKDIEAYERCRDKAGLRFGLIETLRVFDPWETAGTPDRTGMYRGKWQIMDVKTGSVDFPSIQREIAMQLAFYAHCTAYDENRYGDPRFEDNPPVSRTRALVIHLPAGEGRCELHEVDIQAGWEGCLLARQVWEWRKRNGLFTPTDDDGGEPVYANHLERNAARPNIYEQVFLCNTKDELRDLWAVVAKLPAGLDDKFKAAVQQRLGEIEGAA
jgi:hypothetical protein